jgi:hypothetical protein
MRMSALRCPACLALQPVGVLDSESFTCAQCEARLRISRSSRRHTGYAMLIIAGALVYLAGARGWALLALTAIASYPTGLILSFFQLHLFPPSVEINDESD